MDDARAVLADMTPTQRFSVFTLLLTVTALLIFAMHMGATKAKQGATPLPITVEPAQAKELIEQLNSKDLGPAEFRTDMKIWVPIEKSRQALLFLAQEDMLPQDSALGIQKMLEKWTFSTGKPKSDAMMRLGLGNDVARLIETIDIIKEAKVIYSGPGTNRLFRPAQKKRAAVTVRTKFGKELTQDVAETIINLVAAADAGLDKKGVQVTDQHGRHFQAEDRSDIAFVGARKFAAEQRQNRLLADKIESLCRQFVKGCEAWAFVETDIAYDQVQIFHQDYAEGPVLRKQTEKETSESTKSRSAEVGTRPNIAGAGNLQQNGNRELTKTSRKTTDQTNQNDYTQTWTKKSPYLKSKTVSAIVQMPYVYKRGVKQKDGTYKFTQTKDDGTPADYIPEEGPDGSVVMDEDGKPILRKFSSEPLDDAKRLKLQKMIAQAVGISLAEIPERIQILDVPYPESREFVKAPPGATAKLFQVIRMRIMQIGGMMLLLVLSLFVYMQARKAMPSEDVELPDDKTVAIDMLPPMSEQDQEHAAFEAVRAKIADAVAENPNKAAGLVRRWMTKENY